VKVLVIGATGRTGRPVIRRLLARGDDVTAFVRDPTTFPEKHDHLRLVQGDARDAASFDRGVQGQDAVLSVFGPRTMFGKSDLQETFMRNLVSAMERAGVRRLVNLSAWGVGDSAPVLTWYARLFLSAAGEFFADKERGEKILLSSGLDFVNVRPPRLTERRERGGVKAAVAPSSTPALPFLSREDLAAFMVEQLTSDTWVRKSPLIWR
jgi:uncharacterized protein YbjT (DUF2867 family)